MEINVSRRRSNGIDVGSIVLVNSPLTSWCVNQDWRRIGKLLQVMCSRSRRLSGRVSCVHVMTVIEWI